MFDTTAACDVFGPEPDVDWEALERELASQPAVHDAMRALERIEAGPALAAMLSTVSLERLSGADRVAMLRACQRMASHFQAQVYEAMNGVAESVATTLGDDVEPDLVEEAVSTEIRSALHLTRRTADGELAVARGLRRLSGVWEALSAGSIDRQRAASILEGTDHLSVAAARDVARRALERAPEMTNGQLTALVKRLSLEADPQDAKKRYQAAVEDRRVVVQPSVDGTAHLHLMDLPVDTAVRIGDRINDRARQLRRAGDPRTMDQLRADVALDLLAGTTNGAAGSKGGSVTLTTDLATLAELAEHPGELGGYGPVIADIARQVAGDSTDDTWRFVVRDEWGRSVKVGTTRRRPSSRDRRLVETTYPRCVFPGCRMPASQCDLDHRTPWSEGGETTPDNLAPLCRHDHRMRHEVGWRYSRTEKGDHEWISPLGQRYSDAARGP